MRKNRIKSNRRNFSETNILSRSKIVCDRLRRVLFKPKFFAIPLLTVAFGGLSDSVFATDYSIDADQAVITCLDASQNRYFYGLGVPGIDSFDYTKDKLTLNGGMFSVDTNYNPTVENNAQTWFSFNPIDVDSGYYYYKGKELNETEASNLTLGASFDSVKEVSWGNFDLGAGGGTVFVSSGGTALVTGNYNVEGDLSIFGNGAFAIQAVSDRCELYDDTQITKIDGQYVETPWVLPRFHYTGSNSFGNVNVFGSFGSLTTQITGPTSYKDVLVSDGTLLSYGGSQEFNNLTLSSSFASPIVTAFGIIDSSNVDSTEKTQTTINGKINISNAALTLTGDAVYKTDRTNLTGDDRYGLIVNASLPGVGVQANANSVDTNIKLNKLNGDANVDATLWYSNTWNNNGQAMANKWYITEDEYKNQTVLEWESARLNIEDAIENNQVNHYGIAGNGSVYVSTYRGTHELNVPSYNGYTVVMDGGDYSKFNGFTYVTAGTFVLKGDTVYGSQDRDHISNSAMQISGKEYTLGGSEDAKKYYVESSGMLAFYRGDETRANVAPIVNTNSVWFTNGVDGTVNGGARLWLDASYTDPVSGELDPSTDRRLGEINASQIIFGDKTQVWLDRVSTVHSTTNMTFNLTNNYYIANEAGEYVRNPDGTLWALLEENATVLIVGDDIANDIVNDRHEASAEEIEAIFGQAQLVDAKFDATTGAVTMNALNVADYATGRSMTDDEIKFANQLDQNRANVNENTDFYDALYNETDPEKVAQTIRNIARGFGLVNSVHATMQLGMAGSSFYNGLTSGGVVTRAQSGYGEKSADPTVGNTVLGDVNRQEGAAGPENFSNLVGQENNAYPSFGSSYQAPSKKRNIWGSFSHTSLDADSYEQGGLTYDAYKVRRSGFVAGLRYQFDDSTSGGMIFAYSNPEMNQSGTYEGWDAGYSTDMDMDDFQFALHLEKAFGDAWETHFFVGGGSQTLDWNRSVRDSIQDVTQFYNFAGDTTGNTVTATAYLARRVDLTDRWVLRPTVGIDSEHSWLFGFNEVGLNDASGASANLTAATQVFGYNKIQYSRNSGRAGLTTTLNGPLERAGIIGRAFYGVQLGGDDAAEVTMTSQNVAGRNYMPWEATQTGHAMGGESLNLGLSGYLFVNPAKTLTLSGDYNALIYKNATTQNATGSVQYRF